MIPTLASVLFSLLLSASTVVDTLLCSLFVAEHERFGINVAIQGGKSIVDYDTEPLNLGWYIDYAARLAPPRPQGIRYLQLLSSATMPLDPSWLHPIVDANPGAVWVLGNEPDRWLLQDSRTPTQYAQFYHHAYHLIKQRDPGARIATAGIVQPTPIRLAYLDRVLTEYHRLYRQPMPVDIWTVHNFVLREVRHEWGADIPPGMEDVADLGKRYNFFDHGRMDIFQQHIRDFRTWMARNGYRHTPLIVTEYGILMPKEYGFEFERVQRFMLDSFDFFRTATDPATGYPRDDNRLVQAWGWFSLNDKEFDFATFEGFNGNLFDHDSHAITDLGRVFTAYTSPLVDKFQDLAVSGLEVHGGPILDPTLTPTVTITATVINAGNLPATNATVSLWQQRPNLPDVKVAEVTVPTLATHCAPVTPLVFIWNVSDLPPGQVAYTIRIGVGPGQNDRHPTNNQVESALYLLAPGQTLERARLPLIAGP